MPNANMVEIYYMLDELSKLFDVALQAHGLKRGRARPRQPDVGRRGDGHPGPIPHLGLPDPEGLLPRVGLHARSRGIPVGTLLQPLRGAAAAGPPKATALPARPRPGPVHRRLHRGFHPAGSLPPQARAAAPHHAGPLAAHGRGTMGWVYGFKLHLVINEAGEIIQAMLTPANTNDRAPLAREAFTQKLFGWMVSDKGYISQALSERPLAKVIRLETAAKLFLECIV